MASSVDQYYLHVSPADSKSIYSGNTANDFLVELPKSLDLSGEWECALYAATLKAKRQKLATSLTLTCDLMVESYCLGQMCQVLRYLNYRDFKGGRCLYSKPMYFDVLSDRAKLIRFGLKGLDLDPADEVAFSIHLRRKY